METSVTIIGLAITVLMAIPLFFVFRSNIVNKKEIELIKANYSPFNFKLSETLNKKVLAIDEINKGFLFIDCNPKSKSTKFINLKDINSCNLVLTTENSSKDIVKIEFEFAYKENNKKELVSFYTIENDTINQICLHEDHQLAKKWIAKIENSIS